MMCSGLVVLVAVDVLTSLTEAVEKADDDGLCFREKSLGHRQGNLYRCDDPALPVCCEKDQSHTCCENQVARNFDDQLVLWGFLSLTIVCFAGVYIYYAREGDYWESDTLRQAADRMAQRIGVNYFSRKSDRKPGSEDFDMLSLDSRRRNSRQSSGSDVATSISDVQEDDHILGSAGQDPDGVVELNSGGEEEDTLYRP